MPRNVEIKARVDRPDEIRRRVAEFADSDPIDISQDDTFFPCETGRLKVRAFSEDSGELIFYRRADKRGPKESFYLRAPTTAPKALCEALSLAYGQMGRVRKRRTLFHVGRTRVHLDTVEGLGDFLELEVVLDDDEPAEVGYREARELMERLDIAADQLVDGAYVDLIAPDGV